MNEERRTRGLSKGLNIYLAREGLPAPTPRSGVSGSGSVPDEEVWHEVF